MYRPSHASTLQCGEPVRIKSDTGKYKRHNMPRRISINAKNDVDIIPPTLEVDDVSLGIEGLQVSVVTKAAAISHLIKGVTIGPNRTITSEYLTTDVEDGELHHIFETQQQASDRPTSSELHEVCNSDRKSIALSSKHTSDREINKLEEKSRMVMKLMVEMDKQRREEVRQTINVRSANYEKQALKHQEEIKRHQETLKLEAEARALLEKQQILCKRREVELRELHQQEQLKYENEQRVKERNHLIKKAEQRQEEERKKREDRIKQIDTLSHCQTAFVKRYHEILESLKLCKSKKELNDSCSSHFEMVKNLTHTMEHLVKQCKIGEISPLDLQKATAMLSQIGSYSQIIQEEVHKINENIDKSIFTENAVKQQEFERAEASAKPAESVQEVPQAEITPEKQVSPEKCDSSESLADSADKNAIHTYKSMLQFLENFESSYSDLLSDGRHKDFVFKCRKAVNIPVNSISNTSGAHLGDKVQKLTSLLSGQTVETANARVSANAHPHGVAFCMNLLATKFVEQGESVVSSKLETAFPTAAVIVSLWAQFPHFGKLLLAHFYKACPYLVPVLLPQVENQTDIQFYVSLGYTLDADGKVEKQTSYLKRMSGLIRLFAAIIVTKVRGHNVAHPHGPRYAWCWLTCTLNMDPQPDITAVLLLEFLNITGSTMSTTYGHQFQKLLHFICTEYFPMMEKITSSGGPVTRLEVFLEKALKEGRIHPPSGMLPSNFW